MITASDIFIKYGDRILLDHITLVIGENDNIGLVGRNGAGKSTLLNVIAGSLKADKGKLSRPSGSTLGFLHQEMILPEGKTVFEETLTAFKEVKSLEKRIAEITQELADRTDYETAAYTKLLEELAVTTDRFNLLGGEAVEAKAEKVLKGLGFKNTDLYRMTKEFSGGWQMRIELAKILLQQPSYLLLDEPTNHLDIESIIWLETFLKDYPGAVIVISHDKQFLDNVTFRTVEIELGKLFDYKAAYSQFVELRRNRREKQYAAYQNQQRVIAQKERVISRFMAKATKTRMAQSMQKQLDKMELIEIQEEDIAAMRINFPPAPRSGQIVVEGKNIVKKYSELLVLDNVDIKLDRGERVAFVGQNGQGKTTLARILINDLPLSGGELVAGHNIQIGYYAQNQSETLDTGLTLLETMENASPPEMRTRLRAILGAFMFSGEDVEKKVMVLSGGERARLALACLLLKPFNLLVLDEPTNHLDIISKDILKQALMDYDGTLVVVSHDRDFLSGLTNRTIEFRDRELHNYIGDVNAFLEKRALDNMRQVEMKTSPADKKATPKKELDYEERKRLARTVQNAERKIEKLEREISTVETQMASPGFYEKPDTQQLMNSYRKKKDELDKAMEVWEQAQTTLDLSQK